MEEVELQLKTVDQALSEVTNDSDRASLLKLKENLLELLDLTRQTTSEIGENEVNKNIPVLKAIGCTELQNEIEGSGDKLCYDEGNRFADVVEDATEADVMDLQKKLESMIGQKCSAPHKHSWGAVGYHNAIICGLGDSAELLDGHVLSGMVVRVLYTNPTHKEMLPCTYFLEGECKFNDANCHYSHGELVPFNELREYTEPDFEKLRRNCVVLAKMQDRIWHKGRVLCSNFVEKQCRVRLEDNNHKKKEEDFDFENLFPLYHEDQLDDESSSGEGDKELGISDLSDLEEVKQTCLIEKNLFMYPIDQPLGEWEKYTRGIGSKLMAKMGYKQGTGLGWNNQGITTPISAHILPQGCSLDYCMELREAAAEDCKDIFSVEKKLKRQQKKVEEQNAKAYERERQRTDVFSFLNESIFSDKHTSSVNASCSPASSNRISLQNQTTKSLNVESVRISDSIHKKMREIAKLEQSMNRNGKNTEIYKRLQAQLNSCSEELLTLKQVEKSLAKEQATRKTKEKLCIF